ncbi:hypothetical protein B0T25DRAFT_562984 [Lasiosphaeria hispida]|uniref:Uncharacterized protein n=1 Tax=Lasiosphaeria hispida TaxID=260671 RepID=A0AAJ0HWK5_9PEZI|nr:hypothetical protein B0T25DRAFT_562984 [Lasiosphaeria hispida]
MAISYRPVTQSPDIESTYANFKMKEYNKINLDEEPCIFPDCGHSLTVSSMDGQMSMASSYELGKGGVPVKIRGVSEPFSQDFKGIRACPTCRGSLRSIAK